MRVPISILDRQIHLSKLDADKLFGVGYSFQKNRDFVRSNEFECNEKVLLKWKNKKSIELSVVLPFVKYTCVNVFDSDINRNWFSWNTIQIDWEYIISWPNQNIYKNNCVEILRPHIYMSVAQAQDFGFRNNQNVSVYIKRLDYMFSNVKITTKDYFDFDFHINRDIADSIWIYTGDWWEII